MAACTICTMDPCPHLAVAGGTAGGIKGVKYAPSPKPTCIACDRVHRNIGKDSYVVCAWRTFSKAKGVDCLEVGGAEAEEFGRWVASGGWSKPARATLAAAAAATAATVPADPTAPVVPIVAPVAAPSVPNFSLKEEDQAPAPSDEPSEDELEALLAAL